MSCMTIEYWLRGICAEDTKPIFNFTRRYHEPFMYISWYWIILNTIYYSVIGPLDILPHFTWSCMYRLSHRGNKLPFPKTIFFGKNRCGLGASELSSKAQAQSSFAAEKAPVPQSVRVHRFAKFCTSRTEFFGRRDVRTYASFKIVK